MYKSLRIFKLLYLGKKTASSKTHMLKPKEEAKMFVSMFLGEFGNGAQIIKFPSWSNIVSN